MRQSRNSQSNPSQFSRNRTLLASIVAVPLISGLMISQAHATDVYWDSNADTPGAGAAPAGTWGTDAFWTTDSTGSTTPTAAWIAGDAAFFSAGTDATGAFTIGLAANQTASALNIEEGTITIGPAFAVVLGTGAVSVGSGATLITNSSLRISMAAGSAYNLNGGTLQTTNPGANGSFVDGDAIINLGALGGTLSSNVTNILSIVQTNSAISGTGSLTKTGGGVIAIASAATHTGGTFINDGELRIRTTSNRLPIAGAVNITGPGILNLNGVSQRIGALTGNGRIGTGNGTLTVQTSADTTFDGVIENFANAGAGAVTTGFGKLIKNGTGTLTLTGVNTITGSVTLNAGGITVAPGAMLAGAIADLTVTGGTLNLNNAAQTIENLSGTAGTINLGAGHVFTTDPVADTTFAGVIGGAGSLVKANVLSGATLRTLTLTGTNTYAGDTTITGGAIAIASESNIGTSTNAIQFDGGALKTNAAIPFTRNAAINAGGGAIDTNAFDSSIGTVTGAGSFAKNGVGILTAGQVKVGGALAVNVGSLAITTNGGATGMVEATAVTVGAGALLQMNDNDLMVNYTGTSPEFALRDLVKAVAEGGLSGIGFDAGDGNRVIAIAEGTESGLTDLNGVTFADDTVVIGKYTYYGDANLDGQVTSDDYVAVDVGIGVGDSWVEGDFDFSGTVTSDDYVAIDVNLGQGSGNPLAWADLKAEMVALHTSMFGDEYVQRLAIAEAEGFAALVPEPGAISMLGIGLMSLLGRRRRGC